MADETTAPAAPEAAQTTAPPEADAPPVTTAEPGAAETEGHEPSADDAGAEQPKAKSKGGFQRRIDELTQRQRDAQREAEYWREMAMRAVPAQPQAQPAAPQAPQPPDPSKYAGGEWDAEYQKARDAYVREAAAHDAEVRLWQRVHQASIAQQRAQAQAQFQSKAETFQERQAEFSAQVEDYQDAAQAALGALARNRGVADAVGEALADSDAGPEVLYFLGKNPAEARALAQMNPAAAARHIGRIEARIEAQREAAKAATQAPPPPATVRGSSRHTPDPLRESDAEFRARMNRIRAGAR